MSSPFLMSLLGGLAGNYLGSNFLNKDNEQTQGNGLIEQKPPQGLLQSGSFFNPSTREGNIRLAQSFNSMRLNPDANLAQSMENELTTIGKTATATSQRNRTIEYLKAQGKPELIALLNAGMSVEDVLKHANPTPQNRLAIKSSAPQKDPRNGQWYVVQTDPNKLKDQVTRVDIPNTIGMTFEEAQQAEADQKQKLQDIENRQAGIDRATKKGQEHWNNTSKLEGQIWSLESARNLLVEQNVETGLIPNWLAENGIFVNPKNSGFMGELLALQNQLGIDVINSATFGALSEREMAMAMRTNLNLNLPPAELVKMIDQRIDARRKILNELRRRAKALTTGTRTFNEYIQEQTAITDERNKYAYENIIKNISPEVFNDLNIKAKTIQNTWKNRPFKDAKEYWNSLTFEQQKRYMTF